MRILLVEPRPDRAALLAGALAGHEVQTFPTATGALRALEAGGWHALAVGRVQGDVPGSLLVELVSRLSTGKGLAVHLLDEAEGGPGLAAWVASLPTPA